MSVRRLLKFTLNLNKAERRLKVFIGRVVEDGCSLKKVAVIACTLAGYKRTNVYRKVGCKNFRGFAFRQKYRAFWREGWSELHYHVLPESVVI